MHRLRASRVALVASAVTAGACVHPAPRSGVLSAGCHPDLVPTVLHSASTASADRAGANRLKLPWADSLPPVPVTDPAVCQRAALGYARGRLPRGATARATVVRAGGLYFVVGPGDARAGEFLVVGVLDPRFRWLTGLTT